MSNLFDKHWQWDQRGLHDTIAAGKVVRPIVRMLEKKGYDRAEILTMIVDECFHELLVISSEKTRAIFHPEPTPEGEPAVSYAHESNPDGPRYTQYETDPLPNWAVNVKKVGKDVHTEHCCIAHGCKYMDDNCPVYLGTKTQSYPCEDCDEKPTPQVLKVTIEQRRAKAQEQKSESI